MINLKINLLKNRHTLSEADYQRERSYYKNVLVGFVVVVVVALSMGVWQAVLSLRLKKIEARIGELTQELSGLSEANAQQLYLKSRLKLITGFLEGRTVTRAALEKVFSLSLPGVGVNAVGFENEQTMMIQFSADDVFSLAQVVEVMSEEKGFFLQVVSKGITRLKDGSYQLEVWATIPKEVS